MNIRFIYPADCLSSQLSLFVASMAYAQESLADLRTGKEVPSFKYASYSACKGVVAKVFKPLADDKADVIYALLNDTFMNDKTALTDLIELSKTTTVFCYYRGSEFPAAETSTSEDNKFHMVVLPEFFHLHFISTLPNTLALPTRVWNVSSLLNEALAGNVLYPHAMAVKKLLEAEPFSLGLWANLLLDLRVDDFEFLLSKYTPQA